MQTATGFLSDVRYGWRQLQASPSSAMIAVGTLAAAIGLTTAVYSLIYAVSLRPTNIVDIDRVVNIYSEARNGQLSWPAYQTLKASQTVFESVTGWTRVRAPLTGSGAPDVLTGEAVEGNYFEMLKISARLGRTLDRSHDTATSSPVVVLSDGLWRTRYQADPQILGRVINLNGNAFEVIGVAPAAFRGVDMPNLHATVFWVTLAQRRLLEANADAAALHDRDNRWLMVKGRLAPGRSLVDARVEVSGIGKRLASDVERESAARQQSARESWRVVPASSVRMHESVDAVGLPITYGLMAALALVLLIACVNIGNLLLAKSMARRSEIATRLALGASRARLFRQLLTENAVLCALGGSLGLIVAFVLTRFMALRVRLPGLEFAVEPKIVWPVLATATLALCGAGLIFGLAPALSAARTNVRAGMSDGSSSRRHRISTTRLLIVFQLAVSLALLMVGSAILRGFLRYAAHDPGFDLSRMAMISFELRYRWSEDDEGARQFLSQLRDRVKVQPGISAAAVLNTLPIGGPYARATFVSDGLATDGERAHPAKTIISGPEALGVLGIPLIRGRFFGSADTEASSAVVVISRTLAQEVFGTDEVIGRRARLRPQGSSADPKLETVVVTIVGVTGDTDVDNLLDRDRGIVFIPFTQRTNRTMSVAVRTSGDPDLAAAALSALVLDLDPDVVSAVATGDQVLSGELLSARVGASIAGGLGGLAFLLAIVGLYGVVSQLIATRTREIGIRVALGAEPHRVVRMIVREGAALVVGGILFGAILAFWAVGFLRRLVVGLDSQSPGLTLLIGLALGLAAVIACWIPARRAAQIDPNVTLRAL